MRDDWIRGNVFYAAVLTRARYTEDALAVAIARGIRQYVLLGAGFDSYALRWPAKAEDLSLYEIDQPATQSLKMTQLGNFPLAHADRVHFLSADLASESLDAVLARSTFDVTQPAFFSWLGVWMYLTRESNLATLRAIANNSTTGSELVITYHDQASIDDDESHREHASEASQNRPATATAAETTRWVRAVGEPFVSGFHPHELPQVLRDQGLALIEDIDDAQALARYDRANVNHLKPQPIVRIAHAKVI